MKKTHIIIMLLVCNILAVDNAKSSTNLYWSVPITNYYYSAPVMITPTNLVVKWFSPGSRFMVEYDRWDHAINTYCYSPKPNDEVVISTNRVTELFHGEANIFYKFTPVVFTNQLAGFRVEHRYATKWDFTICTGPVESTNLTYYVTLSNPPVEVGEADIELIYHRLNTYEFEFIPYEPDEEDEEE